MVRFKSLLSNSTSKIHNLIKGKIMSRKVQICPVGFEFDRVIKGVNEHSCNIIYLLKSVKRTSKKGHPNKRLIEIADTFVKKLEVHFNQTKICMPIVREANIVTLEKTIEELCEIIKTEVENEGTREIWINISTSTKLFVSAAMYVAAFYPKIIHLFYLDARYYTVNLLLEETTNKEEISEKFQNKGISYEEDEESYKNVNVPTFTMKILKDIKKDIIITLKRVIGSNKEEMVSFKNLLKELGQDSTDKKIKVRYGHHLSQLEKRNWIYERPYQGRQKQFGLTPEGRIMGIIHTYLKEEEVFS